MRWVALSAACVGAPWSSGTAGAWAPRGDLDVGRGELAGFWDGLAGFAQAFALECDRVAHFSFDVVAGVKAG